MSRTDPRAGSDLIGTVSWLRCYATALRPSERPACGLALSPVPLDIGFFDIHPIDDRFFAVWEILGVDVAVDDLGADGGEACRLEKRPVRCYLLLHRSGFATFRWTIEFSGLPTVAHVADLHRPIWVSSAQQTWSLEYANGTVQEVRGGAREAMNWVFFDLHERAMQRKPDTVAIRTWTGDWRTSFDRIRRLRRDGEVASGYPVTLGSHFELAAGGRGAAAAERALAEIVGSTPGASVAGSLLAWHVGESRAGAIVSETAAPDAAFGVYSPRHIQVMEFLALQRGVLRTLQRETQSVITGGATVSRDTARRWNWLLASVTDDYVLHDQAAHLLESYKHHFAARPDLRTIQTLEEQVRRNLGSFQSQFAIADVKTTVVLTALFGVVAALTLGPLARRVAIEITHSHTSPSRFDDAHPAWAIGIDLVLVLLVAVIAARVIARARRFTPL
jgi:hypothetical protein